MVRKEIKKAAICSIPAYCLRGIGSRHILVGGGGGSAKTGVANQLQLYLLGFNSCFDFKIGRFDSSEEVVAHLCASLDTDQFANMNMDCISLTNEPENGRYLIAVGQDEFCALYETQKFCLANVESDSADVPPYLENPSNLSFDFRELIRIESDKHPSDDSYQKCVKLFRSGKDSHIKMVTAGTDGYVRIWSIGKLLKNIRIGNDREKDEELKEVRIMRDVTPEMEICAGSVGVEDIDISSCGTLLATVLPNTTILWDLSCHAKQLLELPPKSEEKSAIEALTKKFKVRSLRFINSKKFIPNIAFLTVHNQRIRSSRELSYLSLWVFETNKDNWQQSKISDSSASGGFRPVRTAIACKESVSCMEISEDGYFVAIGTMGGSVAIFDSQSLSPLLFRGEAHSSFVTALTFLPQRTFDSKNIGQLGSDPKGRRMCSLPLPGICATSCCAIVSISVDRTIQVHQLPFPAPRSLSAFLLRLSLFASILYIILWTLFTRE